MMFDILTIFPDMFSSFLSESILGKAIERGQIEIRIHDIRDFATDRHRMTDDYPYGGGAGMVMKPEPIFRAVEEIKKKRPEAKVVLLTPQGETFRQSMAAEMAGWESLVLICGRYEGVDERVVESLVDYEISIGDYVMNGGEVPAMVIVETVSRLLPGVVGSEESTMQDSFVEHLLDYPHYTRPAEYRGMKVPEILLSGHHDNIAAWRRRQALVRTAQRRPDLLGKATLSEEDKKILKEAGAGINEN